ncbi:MAG: protein kinase [Pyrinomonadaceae bacterium]
MPILMSITAGTLLGRYEIRSMIGAGGMGEVYRAHDPKLQREVAVKILPLAVSQDPARLQRFEQEAHAASRLNHPNILSIYDVGAHDGISFIVSELLEGETLRARMQDGALPGRTVFDFAAQIAGALAVAHERGIVHRDLKPENIFITNDDKVKILDFGLARLVLPRTDEVDMEAPTSLKTAPGLILGTVGYMSPEQVDGRPADHRADLFSFGAVLYEMLAGRRAFRGESTIDTLNAIRKEEPPELSLLNRNVPPGLERVIQRCLEKKPERRFQSASDLAFALEAFSQPAITSGPAVAALPAPARRINNRELLAWVLAGAFLLVAAMFAVLYIRRAPAEAQAARFLVSPPEKATFTYSEEANTLGLSPDGQRLAFTANSEGRKLLYVRPLNALEALPIAGTDGAASPFWSADSHFIAFLAEGKLKRVEATGGAPPQIICDVKGRSITGTWNRAGLILFAMFGGDYGIYRVDASGGAATLVVKNDGARRDDRRRAEPYWPQFLPDGRRFLYHAGSNKGGGTFVRSLDSGEDRTVVLGSSLAMYAPPGFLLYVQQGTLLAQPFDASSAQVKGDPFPIVERVKYLNPTGNAAFWVSQNGVLAYQSRASVSRLVWFDRGGEEQGQVGAPGEYGGLRLSPDAQRVVVSMADPRSSLGLHDLWIYELARNTPTRFTTDIEGKDTEWWPIWSPDSRRVVFATDVGGPPHLYQKGLSDTGGGEQLLPLSGIQVPNDWSADGTFIVYEESGANNGMDLWLLPLSGERKPVPFLQTQFSETQAQFSPDSRWVAYVSDESGQPEVYVQAFTGSPERRRISTHGGARPRWRRDGQELFYLSPDNKLMVVPVTGGTAFAAGEPKALFRINSGVWQDYDVTANGQRFLSNNAAASANSLPITVVLNWTADLKR